MFDRHYSQHTQTKASTASLLSGQYPATHGALRFKPLDESTFTIAKGLQAAGYQTALFSANLWITPGRGIGKEFDATSGPKCGPLAGGGVGRLTGEHCGGILGDLRHWLRSRPPGPFFAYIHLLPPHFPYTADELFAGQAPPNFRLGRLPFSQIRDEGCPTEHETIGPEVVNRYDANLRKADLDVRQIVDLLTEAGVFENTLFILTADHGEAFGEHGYKWHTRCPYDEVVHIPLIVRLPGDARPRGRVSALTQTIDVLPTILDLLALPYPRDSVQGHSLMPLITGEIDKVNEYVFSQTEGDPSCFVAHDARCTLMLYQGGRLRALYDRDSDPWQEHNIVGRRERDESRLTEAFYRFAMQQRYPPLDYLDPNAEVIRLPERSQVPLSDEERRQLQALGYLR